MAAVQKSASMDYGGSDVNLSLIAEIPSYKNALTTGRFRADLLDRLYQRELEDILQNAKDISTDKVSEVDQPIQGPVQLVHGSFRHLVSVREVQSKTGAFLHRTIEITRGPDEEIGFKVRQGDGWSRSDGIFVSRLTLGSIFDHYELVRIGDEIIRVNTVDIKGLNIVDAVSLMQIPRRLVLTVKIVTPFSRKRIAHSPIIDGQNIVGRNRYDLGRMPMSVSNSAYKVANMSISRGPDSSSSGSSSGRSSSGSGSSKDLLSPTFAQNTRPDLGRAPRKLSPIREASSETHLHRIDQQARMRRPCGQRQRLDERSVASEPAYRRPAESSIHSPPKIVIQPEPKNQRTNRR